jgi:hypothetical protein
MCPWQMVDPSSAVLEAIIRRYYCFPLHLFRSSSIAFSNLRVFLVLLVMEYWKKLLSISPWHSAESELSNSVLFVLCRLHQQERRWAVLATASPTPQVAGNSMRSLHIMWWLVVSPSSRCTLSGPSRR